MKPLSPLSEMLVEISRGQARAVQVGAEITEKRYNRGLTALRAAYERSLLDPGAQIPSALSATIIALLAMHTTDQENLYASKMMERDRERGHPEPRADGQMAPWGEMARPGK